MQQINELSTIYIAQMVGVITNIKGKGKGKGARCKVHDRG